MEREQDTVLSTTVAGIEARGLCKSFGARRAVRDVDLTIPAGTTLALLGPNGAGKTTTVRMLAGILRPSGGSAAILGRDIEKEREAAKRLVGVSPQTTAVASRLTAQENLLLVAGAYGLRRDEARRRSEELLAAMGLESRARDRASTLSGGMERRLSIAMAMVADPPVLFLDEPSLGLDPEARSDLWVLLQGFTGKKTILLTTHYLEEAARLADSIVVLVDGEIVAAGSPEDIAKRAPDGASLEAAYLSLVRKEALS